MIRAKSGVALFLATLLCVGLFTTEAEARRRKRRRARTKPHTTHVVEKEKNQTNETSVEPDDSSNTSESSAEETDTQPTSETPAAEEDAVLSKRLMVFSFSGPGSARLRDTLVETLQSRSDIELVSESEVLATSNTPRNARDFVTVAQEHQLAGFISGTVKKKRRRLTLSLQFRNGADGSTIKKVSWIERTPQALNRKMEESFANSFNEAIEEASLPTKEEPKPESKKVVAVEELQEQAAEQSSPEPESKPETPSTHEVQLDAQLGAHLFTRSLSYNQDLFGTLREYDLGLAPAPAFALDIFPGAFVTSGMGARIGLSAAFERTFGLSSKDENQLEFATTEQAYRIGLKARFPLDALEVTPSLGYGSHSFEIADATSPATPSVLPSVAYSFVRIAAGLRAQVTKSIAAGIELGYLQVLSAGEIEEATFFPNLSVAGVEASLGGSVAIVDRLEARLTLDVRRYFFSMNSEPGDTNVAGGAVDQYLGAFIGLGYRLDNGAPPTSLVP